MEEGKIVKQVAEWKPQGKRKRGRPINTWKDGIRESMKIRELKDEECMDRDLWRRKIMFWVEENFVLTEKLLNK
jgi:hypothetical protein